ncbi:MAG: Hpt domain-containing protein [Treponema sp.]|nr:Hpt domain-containing protein [Treponema sp.]
METLDISSALEMLGGEKELLMELLTAFVSGERLDGAKLERLEAQPDKTEAAKYVHFYKGAARQLAAQKLAASGQALEDVLRGKKTGDIAALNKAFLSDYEEAVEAVEASLAVL